MFTGWIGFSQWIKKEFGYYPKKELLIGLGRMSKAEREEHTWFGLYLWENRKQNECKWDTREASVPQKVERLLGT